MPIPRSASTHSQTENELGDVVENVKRRYLNRVGERIVRGLARRELSEELLMEAMALAEVEYGFVLQPLNTGKLQLEAEARVDANGVVKLHNATLVNDQPDDATLDVITLRKPTFTNNGPDNALSNLPEGHPAIRSYAVYPIHDNDIVRSILVLANARKRFDLVVIKRVQNVLDAFIKIQMNRIVYQGINRVISSVGDTNRHLLSLLEASFNPIVTVDENLVITAFNPACETLFDVKISVALGKSLDMFVPQDVLVQVQQNAADYSYSLQTHASEPYAIKQARALKSNAPDTPVELTVFHARAMDRTYTTLLFNDISDRLQSASQLRSALTQYRTLTQMAPVGILKLDAQWLCIYANTMWCELSRLSEKSNLGSGWVEGIHPEDQANTLTNMQQSLTANDSFKAVVRLNRNADKAMWASIHATALLDNMGTLNGCLVVIMDITEQYQAEQRFKQIAHHDALTGLPNRTRFLDQLHLALINRRAYGIVCLLFIDLDGFKAVNDTMGHDAGDELLQQVALRIRQCASDDDIVARLGGDEFTVTVTRFNHVREASVIADSIVHAIKQPFLLLQQEEVYVSASIGIAMATGTNTETVLNANSLIKQADIALYRAKLSGRSRHVFFTPELDQAQRDRSLLITSLRRAVDRQDFELYYQPQVLIKENRLLGFEALLRWPQTAGNFISPGEFIDVLEETGLIGELGEWAISQACAQHRIWLRRSLISPATTMSVNVSARQLGTPNFADRVSAIIQRQSMRPDSLILEITESALVETIETDVINEIKALGVQISLDDFGTGYSSLAYLSQLPLDHLKIDRSFIADIERYPHAVTVVKSIIALSNTLGIKVIAEGVESESVLPLLAEEGCEGYQGYLFSQPLPARKMAQKLQNLNTIKLSHYANFIDLGAIS